MKNSTRDVLWASILAIAAFDLYISFLSKAYVFEGLIRAMPIETGRWVHLLPGNYLLYGPLGLIFHTVLHLAGIQQPAFLSLQIMDALLGASGIFVFYLMLRKLGGDVFSGVVWSGILACSLGYWMWSTDAENYILSTFLLLTTFYFLVRYAKRDPIDPVTLGALHGLAILGHIINGIFGLVVLWVLFATHGPRWRRPTLRYLAAVTMVAGGAYGMVLAFVRKPATFQEGLQWFLGSAGVHSGGVWSVSKLVDWLKMSLHIWVSFCPTYTQPAAWIWAYVVLAISCFLLLVFALALLVRLGDIFDANSAVVGGCLIWLAVYALVFTRWEPWTMVYRVSDLVPVCLLLFFGYQSIPAHRRIWRGAAALLAVCLMVGNGSAEIYPRSFATNNPNLARMAFVKANTGDQDWITGTGGIDEIYLPYFAQRRPIVIERYATNPEQLKMLLQELQVHDQTVFVTSTVLESEIWKSFFSRYTLTLKASDPSGFALFQVGRYHRSNANDSPDPSA